MQPLRVYEYLVLARRPILEKTRELDSEQYSRLFPIGSGTLAGILTHIMTCEWYYIERLEHHDVPPYEQWPMRSEDPPPFAQLAAEWEKQAARTHAALSAVRDWSRIVQYDVTDDSGQQIRVSTNALDLFTQLALHETHHRAQALNILRQLGVTFGDLDFNAFMYDRRPILAV